MTLTGNIQSLKDNAQGTLASGISAATLSLPLGVGQGALFPQAYNGTCTSLGTATALNCTGILATVGSGVVGKPIFNATDGSIGIIKSITTNQIVTTPLLGGTANIWANSASWRIDEFVVTLTKVSLSAYNVETVTQQEEALVIGRSSDTLTVATGGRGYNSTTANTFATSDYVRLNVISPNFQRLVEYVAELAKQEETDGATIAGHTTSIANILSNASFYAVATGSSNAYAGTYANLPAIAAGLTVAFKANFTNSGAATFNYNGGGAVAIKKLDGATALAAGDIQNGQTVTVRHDGTNWQMISPLGQSGTSTVKAVFLGATSSAAVGASSTAAFLLDTNNYTIPANDLVAGVCYEIEASGTYTWGAGSLEMDLFLGSTLVTGAVLTPAANGQWNAKGKAYGTAAAGGSAAVRGELLFTLGSGGNNKAASSYQSTAVATNGSLVLQLNVQFGTSNASNSVTCATMSVKKTSTSPF